MKMIMAVVSPAEARGVVNELVVAGHTATSVEGRGGVLRQQYDTLFIATEDEDLEEILAIIRRSCHSCVEVERLGTSTTGPAALSRDIAEVGGAAVFVWDLERMGRY